MKTTFIYALCDPRTELVRYLGKSDRPRVRFGFHIRDKKDTYKTRWIAALGRVGLAPTLEILDEVPDSQWEFWEREYIRVFKAIYFPLTNTTDGGECPTIPRTAEHTRKIVESNRRTRLLHPISSAELARLRSLRRGTTLSAEHKRAISQANSRPKSAETRRRMKAAWAKRKQEKSL